METELTVIRKERLADYMFSSYTTENVNRQGRPYLYFILIENHIVDNILQGLQYDFQLHPKP